MKFVFSGIRDSDLQKYIERNGGRVVTSVSKGSILLCKDVESTTSKVVKAKELGNKVLDYSTFKKECN